jgi:hypothetical protein
MARRSPPKHPFETLSPQQFQELALGMAALYVDAMFTPDEPGWCDPAHAQWRFDPHLSISELGPEQGWLTLIQEDIQNWTEEGQPNRFRDMIRHRIRMPIVVLVRDEQHYVWDGAHRIGASLLAGRTTIPAVIGAAPSLALSPTARP